MSVPREARKPRRLKTRAFSGLGGALLALAVAPLVTACSYVGGFLSAQSPRTLFERGYFAEMRAVEGRPSPRSAEGLRILLDQRYRPPGLSRDDLAHRLDAYAPGSGAGPWPLLVYAHGGGLNAGAKDDETEVNRNFAIALARLGFVVLNINHRLAREAPHPAQVEDMAAAVRWGIDHAADLGADPDRIVLAGFSSGGYLAALLAGDPRYLQAQRVAPERLSAVVAVSGFFDLEHLATSFLVRRFIVEPAFGQRGPLWIEASPLSHAGSHWPPALLISAAEDRAAGPESDALCLRLNQAGVTCERLVVPGSQHSTAIARLGDGRSPEEFEAMAAFLASATAARHNGRGAP